MSTTLADLQREWVKRVLDTDLDALALANNRQMRRKIGFEQQAFEQRSTRPQRPNPAPQRQPEVNREENPPEQPRENPAPPRVAPPNPAEMFRIARERAQPMIDQANHIQVATPTQTKIKQALIAAQNRVTEAVRAQLWPEATTALNETVAVAKQLIASKAAVDKRSQGQKDGYDALKPALDKVKTGYFNNPKSGSAAIKKESLSPGTEFKSLLASMEKVEKQRAKNYANPKEALRAATELVENARAYLDHYDARYAKVKPDSKAERKKQIAEESFKQGRHLLLALQFDSLGGPPGNDRPWSQDQDVQFSQVQSQFFFETGYKQASPLGAGDVAGANETLWVNSSQFDPKGKEKQTKQLLFKPREGEKPALEDDDGKHGVAAVKEAIASSTSKLIAEQTGLDLAVPETSVVGIGGYALPEGKRGEVRLGSVQQFAPNLGGLRDKGASELAKVPKEDWHRSAVLDIITLNVDRHDDNLMLQKTDDPSVRRIVPIDHGNTLPTPKDFKSSAEDFAGCKPTGPIQNVALRQPAMYEPFTPEMLESVSRLDPDALAANMRQHCQRLDGVNPDLKATELLADAAIELSRRTTIFLKRAAPVLSPAEVMLAITAFKDDFADFDQEINGLCDRVLQAQQNKGEAYKGVMLAPNPVRADLLKRLRANGWDDSELVRKSPDIALKLLTRNVKNDPKPRDPEQAIAESDFVAGTRILVNELLESSDKAYDRIWPGVDLRFPVVAENVRLRDTIETAQIGTEQEAVALHASTVQYMEARKAAMAAYFLDEATKLHRANSNLASGEEKKSIETWFNNCKQHAANSYPQGASEALDRLRQLVQPIADRPTGPVIQKLDEAGNYIKPKVPEGEKKLADATALLTQLRDAATRAVRGRAAGQDQEIEAASSEAERIKGAFDELLGQAKQWVAGIERSFEPMLPRDSEMVPALTQDKKNLDTLYRKVLQDIDNIDFLSEPVNAALELVGQARSREANQEALLAKVIYADQNTCQTMTVRASQFEASAATDLDGIEDGLAAIRKEGVQEDGRKRSIATTRKLIQEAIGKINLLGDELKAAQTFAAEKLQSYPPEIDKTAEPFKEPFEQFDLVTQKLEALREAHRKLAAKVKRLGQDLISLM